MKILLFTPDNQLDHDRLAKYYPISDLIIYPINVNQKVALIRKSLDSYRKSIHSLGITHIIVLAANLFKILTKEKTVGHSYGKILPSKYKGYEDILISIAPSYQSLFHNPDNIEKINMTLQAVLYGEKQYKQVNGTYPTSSKLAIEALQSLHQYKVLAVDIEGYSLHYTKAQIATIAFAWNETEGIAFQSILEEKDIGYHLADFFQTYQGKLIFHNSSYDVSVMIYELFMQSKLDYKNMLDALDIFYRDCEDTKLMVYLIKNSTSEISLALKDNILNEYGDYGEDVTDITKIPLPRLLKYNLIDACGTFWLYKKYQILLKEAHQIDLYYKQFIPAQKVLTYMEMVGMPMIPDKIQYAKKQLEKIIAIKLNIIDNHPYIKDIELILQKNKVIEDNKTLKKLVRKLEDIKRIPFNAGSSKHLGILLHEKMGLPILDLTPTGQPATGEDTIKKLLKLLENNTDNKILLLEAIIELGKAEKILNTFIKAFEQAEDRGDGRVYLTGNFNLGGTQSMRLSSSSPNLTNLPSGSTYGKLIKQCFVPPVNKLIASCDYTALEAMVDALLTQDPNKLKVYLDYYDSHCLNTYAYWKNKMPDIQEKVEIAETATKFWKENGEYFCE